MQKEKRTDGKATLEISGRDQPDQRLYLSKDQERLVWLLDHAENELWLSLIHISNCTEPSYSITASLTGPLPVISTLWAKGLNGRDVYKRQEPECIPKELFAAFGCLP